MRISSPELSESESPLIRRQPLSFAHCSIGPYIPGIRSSTSTMENRQRCPDAPRFLMSLLAPWKTLLKCQQIYNQNCFLLLLSQTYVDRICSEKDLFPVFHLLRQPLEIAVVERAGACLVHRLAAQFSTTSFSDRNCSSW